MALWETMVNGGKAVGYGVGRVLQWIVSPAVFTVRTGIQLLEEVLATQNALPALVNEPKSRMVFDGATYIVVHDLLPIFALHWLNNTIQYRSRNQLVSEGWELPYALFLTGLTAVDYGVKWYSMREGVGAVVRMYALTSVAPAAFKTDSKIPPIPLCVDEKCTTKRKMKGSVRELMFLFVNQVTMWTLGKADLPYLSEPILQNLLASLGQLSDPNEPLFFDASTLKLLEMFIVGLYITRTVTPEVCDRHLFPAMRKDAVLALGITYEMLSRLVSLLLLSTSGEMPYLFNKVVSMLLLLLLTNIAAHMNLPVQKMNGGVLTTDLWDKYERFWRFLSNVILDGLKVRVPIDLKPEDDAEPIVSLSTALQTATKVLEYDKSASTIETNPGVLVRSTRALKVLVLPRSLHSTHDFVNDPLLSMYWGAQANFSVSFCLPKLIIALV